MSAPISLKLLTDAVVASYIHEISTRHRREGAASEGPVVSNVSTRSALQQILQPPEVRLVGPAHCP